MRFRVFHLRSWGRKKTAREKKVSSSLCMSRSIFSKISYNCFMVLKSDSHTQHSYLLLIGTMGPTTAWKDSQETWLPESQISGTCKFSRCRPAESLEKYRIAITDSVPQHWLSSRLSRSLVQGAVVYGEQSSWSLIYSIWCRSRQKRKTKRRWR